MTHVCDIPSDRYKPGDHYFCECDKCWFLNPITNKWEFTGMWDEILDRERKKTFDN